VPRSIYEEARDVARELAKTEAFERSRRDRDRPGGKREHQPDARDLVVKTYLKYHEAPAFTDEMDSLLHKRHGFAAERELRLLKFDQAHFNALVPKDGSVPQLPEYIYLDWVLSDVIDEIIVSPYADVNYEDLVRHAINATDPNLVDRVLLSVLHERRYAPGF
jgi:hypothetical protein